eukprot:c3456_g2_i1 orf=69-332(-)
MKSCAPFKHELTHTSKSIVLYALIEINPRDEILYSIQTQANIQLKIKSIALYALIEINPCDEILFSSQTRANTYLKIHSILCYASLK